MKRWLCERFFRALGWVQFGITGQPELLEDLMKPDFLVAMMRRAARNDANARAEAMIAELRAENDAAERELN